MITTGIYHGMIEILPGLANIFNLQEIKMLVQHNMENLGRKISSVALIQTVMVGLISWTLSHLMQMNIWIQI